MRKTIDLHQMLHFDYNVSNFIEVYVSRILYFLIDAFMHKLVLIQTT